MNRMNMLDRYADGLPFLKMHGLGNDFVVVDARLVDSPVTEAMARAVGDRHQHPGEQGDDGNHDQQFDQREGFARPRPDLRGCGPEKAGLRSRSVCCSAFHCP